MFTPFAFIKTSLQYMSATGGTVTTDGDYKIHTFTGSADFIVTSPGDAEVFLVGGGGGGSRGGPGGGAGGVVWVPSLFVTSSTYPIVIGAGGAGGFGTDAENGQNTTGLDLTALGGGAGPINLATTSGSNGGSGGGGNPAGIALQQSQPGLSGLYGYGSDGDSGGGGATETGESSATYNGGDGILFYGNYYAGGGGAAGGNAADKSQGGLGGGGNGSNFYFSTCYTNTAGAPNTGGGGGGGGTFSGACPYAAGQPGGSGIVIIRYKFQ